MNILGIEIKTALYKSIPYCMNVDNGRKKSQKEFIKTYYIKDKKQRLNKVRELLKNNVDTEHNITVTKQSFIKWNEYGFSSIKEYLDLQNKSMFFNVWVEVSNKRALEIEVYVSDIYSEAETLAKKDEYTAICFLIDKQYSEHKNVFDDIKSDVAFRLQYNQLIYDLLQLKINEISNISIDDIRETLTIRTKKPLIWNAKKSSIGTLFGMLHDAKIIEGSKADIIRSLGTMFNNLSESSIKDNVNLKVNTNDEKCLYDKETEDKAKEWIIYLKESTTKSK